MSAKEMDATVRESSFDIFLTRLRRLTSYGKPTRVHSGWSFAFMERSPELEWTMESHHEKPRTGGTRKFNSNIVRDMATKYSACMAVRTAMRNCLGALAACADRRRQTAQLPHNHDDIHITFKAAASRIGDTATQRGESWTQRCLQERQSGQFGPARGARPRSPRLEVLPVWHQFGANARVEFC